MLQLITTVLLLLLLCPPLFAEPLQLDDVVRIALANHQRIIQSRENQAAATELATAAFRERLPKLDFGFSYDHLRDQPFEIIHGAAQIVNDHDLYHYQLSLSQPLFSGYALTARQKLAELDADMSAFELLQARHGLALEVRIAALQLLQYKTAEALAVQQRDQFKSHLHDVKTAFDEGIVPGNDRLKAEVMLASAEQQLQVATSRVLLACGRLNLLLGRSQQQQVELLEPLAGEFSTRSLTHLIEIALQQRPEIKLARQTLAAAGEDVRLARSSYYPHLALVARYWRDGNDPAASDNPYRNQDNALIGLHLDWNLFSSGADRARVIAGQHQQRARLQALKDLEDNIRLQVQDALLQLEVATSNQKTAATALEQARENQRLAVLQFRENLISTSDLLDARTLLTQAETEYQSAHYGLLISQARLNYVIGEEPQAGQVN